MKLFFYQWLGVALQALPNWMFGRWAWLRRLESWALLRFALAHMDKLTKGGTR